jgi:hypothetical protein
MYVYICHIYMFIHSHADEHWFVPSFWILLNPAAVNKDVQVSVGHFWFYFEFPKLLRMVLCKNLFAIRISSLLMFKPF